LDPGSIPGASTKIIFNLRLPISDLAIVELGNFSRVITLSKYSIGNRQSAIGNRQSKILKEATMHLVRRSFLVVLMTLFVGVGTGVAQSRIQLVQGKRSIQDKVTFVIEVGRDRANNPRYANGPEHLQIFARWQQAATGKIFLDGKALGRLDESTSFNSNPFDVTYGRHTLTLQFTSPVVLTDFYVTVPGGVARELLDEQEQAVTLTPDLSKRVGELERKVQDLEAEISSLKKRRNH
jgi:hypothetical protein